MLLCSRQDFICKKFFSDDERWKMRRFLLVLSVFIAIVGGLDTAIEPSSSIQAQSFDSPPQNFQGVFYNSDVGRGGDVSISEADFQSSSVSGFMNFTERVEDDNALCGAGDLLGTRVDHMVYASFVSNDPDKKCGFDRNGIFTITATLDLESSHLYGDYSSKNANGSQLLEASGVFELWPDGNLPSPQLYLGSFMNTNVQRGGSVMLSIYLGEKIVFGYINFTNVPSESALCGAGAFTGIRNSDDTIQFSFISRDPDQGCASSLARRLTVNADLSNDLKTISGTYDAGTFSVELVQAVYLPFVKR
jgi:hypothetical protein